MTRDMRPETIKHQAPSTKHQATRDLSQVSCLLSPVSGVTLVELVVAGTLGVMVILAIQRIDATRIALMGEIRRVSSEAPAEATRALSHMAAMFEQADRVILVDPGTPGCGAGCSADIWLRIPLANDLDNAANYQWAQYRLVGSADGPQVRFYRLTGDCNPDDRFLYITSLVVTYEPVAGAPPGSEPDPANFPNLAAEQDNNVLTIRVDSTDRQTNETTTYWAGAALRAGTYSDVATGVSDVSPPPASGC